MLYKQVIEKIFALPKSKTANWSLSNMERLCKQYHHPEKAFPTIHVAGTNGKGSVCTKIAHSLQQEGYKTGLYTSPHISSFRERIQINGIMIPEEEITTLFDKMMLSATFFEIATLLAFLHFRQNQVDIAIIETGLGGRLDATNVITPLLSIITSIGYDHTEILGPTLTDITREKAGIIKKGVPILIGPDVPPQIVKEKAEELGCPLYQSVFQNENYDIENQETARLALSILTPYFPTSEESQLAGLKQMPPCRFERHVHKKEVILDVAHNSHGFAKLLEMLRHIFPDHEYRFVVGFSKGKDLSDCALLIQDNACAIHLICGPNPRLAQVEEVQNYFQNPHIEKSIKEGIKNALESHNPKPEVVVIAGSFFVMTEARTFLQLASKGSTTF